MSLWILLSPLLPIHFPPLNHALFLSVFLSHSLSLPPLSVCLSVSFFLRLFLSYSSFILFFPCFFSVIFSWCLSFWTSFLSPFSSFLFFPIFNLSPFSLFLFCFSYSLPILWTNPEFLKQRTAGQNHLRAVQCQLRSTIDSYAVIELIKGRSKQSKLHSAVTRQQWCLEERPQPSSQACLLGADYWCRHPGRGSSMYNIILSLSPLFLQYREQNAINARRNGANWAALNTAVTNGVCCEAWVHFRS